jgi:uncharacterized membrane protein YphA (DoxX/SURF4 family)
MPTATSSSSSLWPVSLRIAAFLLRTLVGWHFLYEGLAKFLDPQWTSAGYLAQSRWLLADLFRWMASEPSVLRVVDLLNIAGLIAVGAGLMLGVGVRPACLVGAFLLLLYYVANPPLEGLEFGSPEGKYLLVNKNLIELAALAVLGLMPSGLLPGLGRLLSSSSESSTPMAAPLRVRVPREENQWIARSAAGRRELLRNLAVVPFVGAFVLAALKRHGWRSHEEDALVRVDTTSQASVRTASAATLDHLKGLAPRGRLGRLEVSRIIVGGNLISGFAHARDLIYVSPLLKAYFHDDKVIETLWLCESAGINTAVLRTDADTIRILEKYWKKGGRIQWIAQVYPRENDVASNIDLALDHGAVAAFIQGGIADDFIKRGRLDLMEQALARIASRVPAGTAGHALQTIRAVEEAAFPADFYMKTLHHENYWSARRPEQTEDVVSNKADNYWALAPAETIAYMRGIHKPWIAYKVLAAGAIPPADGFRYAFENGADFICVGMFDFQVVENVNVVGQLFQQGWQRSRNWMA